MKLSPLPKRKRKVAGPKMAPLISMPEIAPLSDTEWQLFLDRLPSRPELTALRSKLDWLMWTYLGVLQAEAASPSAREVALRLKQIARLSQEFAQNLVALDLGWGREEAGSFNTASEVAADILANISIKPENRSVLAAAVSANEVLAAVAVREAGKLGDRSRKGGRIHGKPTAWLLRQLVELLHESGLPISPSPKWDDPCCVLSQHFLGVVRTHAKTLREPEWARKEIQTVLMLDKQAFLARLRQAVPPHEESSLPI